MKRDGGVLISTPHDSDKATRTRLKRCVHCQHLWADEPGSRRLRGFCTRCMGDVCGQQHCVARGCLHWEAELELMEAGLPLDFRKVTASVPADVPRG